jgi:two-component system response regulator FlrC
MRSALFTALTRLGHAVELAEDGEEALAKAQSQKFDLVLCDLRLPKLSGPLFVRKALQARPETPIIAMSQGGGVEEAVGAMREGAWDFLLKPFPAGVVEEAVNRVFSAGEESAPAPAASPASEPARRPIISQSPVMERLLALARRLAGSSATVLLQGESGTGKELLARFIHENSVRRDGPFVAINCAGLPESLLESELFGHEKGAFTGALNRKPGKFDLASGGTILLDEISEMDIALQAKLLRALQEGEIDPVGGKGPHKIDARVIATTNRRLMDWVEEGKFRQDLYYRLNVMPFFIPALRERKEDIVPLAEYFAEKHAALNGLPIPRVAPEAMDALMSSDWPGNVRELENAVARATLMTMGSVIEAQDIFMDEKGFLSALEKNDKNDKNDKNEKNAQNAQPAQPAAAARIALAVPEGFAAAGASPAPNPPLDPALKAAPDDDESAGDPIALAEDPPAGAGTGMPLMTIDEMEKRLIGRTLRETSGNRKMAAKLLGISVRTLRNKLNEYRGASSMEIAAAAG